MSVRSLWKNAFAAFLILAVCQIAVVAQYTTEEYAAYESAINADPAEREDTIVEFITTNPRSTLVEYAIGSYLQLMQEYQNQGQSQNVFSAGEKLLTLKPDELNTLYMTAYAAYVLQQYEKVTTYAEQVYTQQPDAGIASILAMSHLQLNNEEKVIEYGGKACAELDPKDCYEIMSALAKIYAGRKNWTEAAPYAEKTIEGFDAAQKPPQVSESRWVEVMNKEKATAYTILGREAAEGKNWTTAISHYSEVLTLSDDPALKGEAYFYTGMGRWEQKQLDPAMEAFAQGSVQRGAPHAKNCRQYLETLYKSGHNDSLAGLEEFVERVTR
ncbi:MAG: hypothetical protein O6826_03700 [Acidobacteria bacterium]|nr:hypothetical protein [Acidobacteriota bacterium]MCZ6768425.1 hypothetical protein [Acidobacteriota bacterium]MCZ6877409.1 hypothetical protein [Acidobacteriota bacterium]